ncbi:MAG: E2/UBC family protein [Gemmatimonadota bacterium]
MSATNEGTVSALPAYGVARLVAELQRGGYEVAAVHAADMDFAIISGYLVPAGRFAERQIDLGLPAPPDYPNRVGSSIHIRATPQLLEYENVSGVRNIIASALGPDWRYWSHQFPWAGERDGSARRLLAHVASIFERA